MEVEGFTTHVLTALNGEVPKNVSKQTYIIVTLFCGSYFYRMWLDKLCHSTDVNIRKRVSATTCVRARVRVFVRVFACVRACLRACVCVVRQP